jgi:hypothetical protein
VQPDGGQQSEPDDHPDHPGENDQRADNTVCVARRVRERRGVDRRDGEPKAKARQGQDRSRGPGLK